MIKRLLVFLALTIFFFTQTKIVHAIYDPTSLDNNKIGIHIFSEKDLDDAAKLVNSGGGDWGYVTLVITEGERDHDRWQQVFDQMRRLHLIPIIRIASKAAGDTWEKPKEEEINNWIAFLNSLNWVTENRYVIISNEPNHANEWGGQINPTEYATYLKEFSQKLKSASNDFYVLPAGLDASANNSSGTMEESKYLKAMVKAVPDVFDFIDGWTSHSYPNPDFSGSETATGKGTIRTFEWEATYLKTLGITKNLPVFITETGWSNKSISEEDVAKKISYAYKNVWNNSQIVAVTPFILNYPQAPFGQFSWKNSDGKFYKIYSEVQSLEKVPGKPNQIVKGDILAAFAQPVAPVGSDFVGAILAKNTGQSIWNSKDISISSDTGDVLLRNYSFNEIEPTRLGLIIFRAAAPENTGIYSKSLFLNKTSGGRVTKSFPIETAVIKIDQAQVQNFIGGAQSFFKSVFKF